MNGSALPPDVGPCPLCDQSCSGHGLQLITMFVASTADGKFVTVPVHVGCFIDAIAGRVQDAVLHAMQTGRVSVGLDRADGESMNDVIGSLLGRVIHHYVRVG